MTLYHNWQVFLKYHPHSSFCHVGEEHSSPHQNTLCFQFELLYESQGHRVLTTLFCVPSFLAARTLQISTTIVLSGLSEVIFHSKAYWMLHMVFLFIFPSNCTFYISNLSIRLQIDMCEHANLFLFYCANCLLSASIVIRLWNWHFLVYLYYTALSLWYSSFITMKYILYVILYWLLFAYCMCVCVSVPVFNLSITPWSYYVPTEFWLVWLLISSVNVA